MILAATLIARNEARCIARCLGSVRPWVDRMVVLDTGSTDDTATLARSCGAEVHRLPWLDDFSAARNHALELAGADWNLIIDADEWITAGGEGLRGWCAGPARLGTVSVLSTYDDARSRAAGGAEPASRHWLTRILPRGVRYRGRVHEQAVSALPRERSDLHIEHDGYRDAQLARKRDRNRLLLLLDLQDYPDDPYILYQLGKEDEGAEDFAAACGWYGKALVLTPGNANWLHELLVRQLHCLGQSGRLDEALALAEARMADWRESPDFFFVLGNLLLECAASEPARALDHWLPLAVSCWERCLTIGERPDLEGSVEGRGSHLARYNLDLVRSQTARIGG